MKKLTLAAAVIILALSLTSCGEKGDVSVTSTPEVKESPFIDMMPDGNDTVTGDGEVDKYNYEKGTSGRDNDKSGKADDPLTDGNVKNDIPGNEDGIEGISGQEGLGGLI